jgi:hypothetical protein
MVILMDRLCVVAVLFAGQTSWREFTPRDGIFTVMLPGSPVEAKQTIAAGEGKAEVRRFLYDLKEGAYVVIVTDFPKVEGSIERRLSNARDGAIAAAQGKLLHERRIKLGQLPGRELWIDGGKAGLMHTRIYAAPQRLVQTLAIGPKTFVETKDTARFLDSLKVNK